MRDLRKGVWTELYNGRSTDTYRRNLQRASFRSLRLFINKAKIKEGAMQATLNKVVSM